MVTMKKSDIKKYKEVILYIFFGGLTTLVSIGSFAWCDVAMGMNPLFANVISWILAVTFAFVTNKRWVFEAKTEGWKDTLGQAAQFYSGRLLTLGMEEVILLIFINGLGWNSIVVKIVAQFFVLVANFIISKWFVFKE